MKRPLVKFLPFIIAAAVAIGMLFGMRLQESLSYDGLVLPVEELPESSITEALKHIRSKYYGSVDYESLADNVLEETVSSLDPYSHYFSPQRDEDYSRYVQGLYKGVGVEYALYNDTCYITAILPDSPMENAGIKRGDLILSIDNIPITNAGISLDSIRALSKKEKGERILFSILKNTGTKEIEDYNLQISDVALPLVKSYRFEDAPEIIYIEISRFYNGVFRDFMDIIDGHQQDHSEPFDLIVDLRGNMGGVVEETVKIINQLVEEKNVLLLSTVNNVAKSKTYKSNGRIYYMIGRICVIIDERSASASEILAAAVQDLSRGVIIGQPSYGKGVIQQNYDLSNDGSINITIGEYVLPSGRKIGIKDSIDTVFYAKNGKMIPIGSGVQPDILISTCQNERHSDFQSEVIHSKLWEDDLLFAFINSDQKKHADRDSCETIHRQLEYWHAINASVENGSHINSNYCDIAIQKAVEVLRSKVNYDRVLLEG